MNPTKGDLEKAEYLYSMNLWGEREDIILNIAQVLADTRAEAVQIPLSLLKEGLELMKKINGDDSKCVKGHPLDCPNHTWIHYAEVELCKHSLSAEQSETGGEGK